MRISDWSSDVCSSDLCAPIERIFMLGRAQQIEDRRGAVGLAWPHIFGQSGRIGAAHGVSPDPPAEPHVQLSPHAALHCDEPRSEEHTSELQSLMRISYAVF